MAKGNIVCSYHLYLGLESVSESDRWLHEGGICGDKLEFERVKKTTHLQSIELLTVFKVVPKLAVLQSYTQTGNTPFG